MLHSLHPVYQLSSITLRLFLVILFLTVSLQAQAQQTKNVPKSPKGWSKSKVSGKPAHTCFTKDGLKTPDYVVVKYYDRELLVDASIESWLINRLNGKAPLGGQWSGPTKNLTRQTANIYTAQRDFDYKDTKHSIKVSAVCVDKLNVRMAATIHSETDAWQKNELDAETIRFQLLKLEIEAAKKDKRGLAVEKSPPKVKGIKAGGTIKPGLYIGSSVTRKDNKAGARIELLMFANGEYEFISRKRNNTGTATYSNATGRLNVDAPIENHYSNWNTEFCVYGRDSKKRPVIHAETKYRLTRLVWTKDSDRPSPSELKQQEQIAKAEAKRYKHTTEPGDGVSTDEIAAVIYSQDSAFRSGAVQIDYEGYMLMKDGRVLDGLPCSPDMLDVAASRSRAPDSWGWWRKAKDDKKNRYEFSWPYRPQEFRMPKGSQGVGLPLDAKTKLSGDFGAASTQVNLASQYSSVRWWGIKLDKNGRFLKYRRGSTQAGGTPGMETMVTNVWNDEGSVTALSGPAVVGGSKKKFNNPALDRMGKYEFDGYRLTLTFDSGRVEHLATFTNSNKSAIWFEGRMLHKQKEKK